MMFLILLTFVLATVIYAMGIVFGARWPGRNPEVAKAGVELLVRTFGRDTDGS